jgi:hypothetical protein
MNNSFLTVQLTSTATDQFKLHRSPAVSTDHLILTVEGIETDTIGVLGGIYNDLTTFNMEELSVADIVRWGL